MLYGIIASANSVGGISVPAAYGSADFVAGNYSYNGSAVALSDVITDEEPTAITASGLLLTTGHAPIPFVSTFYDAMFSFNWTIVFELDINANDGNHIILNIGSETPTYGYTNDVLLTNNAEWDAVDRNNDYPGTPPGTGDSVSRNPYDANGLTNGIHKFGVTRTDDFISLSVDGFPAVMVNTPTFFINDPDTGSTDVGAVMGAFRNAGSTVPNSFYVRSINIFDPVTDYQLAILTS